MILQCLSPPAWITKGIIFDSADNGGLADDHGKWEAPTRSKMIVRQLDETFRVSTQCFWENGIALAVTVVLPLSPIMLIAAPFCIDDAWLGLTDSLAATYQREILWLSESAAAGFLEHSL